MKTQPHSEPHSDTIFLLFVLSKPQSISSNSDCEAVRYPVPHRRWSHEPLEETKGQKWVWNQRLNLVCTQNIMIRLGYFFLSRQEWSCYCPTFAFEQLLKENVGKWWDASPSYSTPWWWVRDFPLHDWTWKIFGVWPQDFYSSAGQRWKLELSVLQWYTLRFLDVEHLDFSW